MPYVASDFEYKDPKPYTNRSKCHKPDDVGRIGRLNRAEAKYRKTRTHVGKGRTLRSHRAGK